MMSNGYDDHGLPPIRPEGEHSIAVSNEYAVSGILAALWMRHDGHPGQLVDVSMHEAVSATTEGAFPNWEYFGRLVQRQTGRHAAPDPTAAWQYLAADGQYVCLINGGLPRGNSAWDGLLDWMDEHGAAADLRDEQYQELLFSDPRANPEGRTACRRHDRCVCSEPTGRGGVSAQPVLALCLGDRAAARGESG